MRITGVILKIESAIILSATVIVMCFLSQASFSGISWNNSLVTVAKMHKRHRNDFASTPYAAEEAPEPQVQCKIPLKRVRNVLLSYSDPLRAFIRNLYLHVSSPYNAFFSFKTSTDPFALHGELIV
jgi:hypothetical protein